MYRFRIDRLRPLARELWSDGRGRILIGVAGGWFLSLGARLVFPALLPLLRDSFSFDLGTAGLLLGVLWVAYALGQFPGGVLGDRLGEGNALVISTVVSGAMVGVIAGANTAFVLFAATACFGFSTAIFGPARFTILSAVYDERDGTAVGLTLSAGEAGNAILPVFATVLATYASWRLGFGALVPLFALAAIGIWWFVPGRATDAASAVDSLSLATFRYVARNTFRRSVVVVTTVHLFLFFVYLGFTGFYPTYLIEVKGLSPGVASTLFGLFFVVGIFVQPLAGAGGDRFGTRSVLFVVVGLGAVSLVALPFVSSLVSLVVTTIVASSLVGVTPLTQTYLVNALPADMKGSGLGMLRTGHIALGATGPLAVGLLADLGYFSESFWMLAAVCVGGIVLTTALGRG